MTRVQLNSKERKYVGLKYPELQDRLMEETKYGNTFAGLLNITSRIIFKPARDEKHRLKNLAVRLSRIHQLMDRYNIHLPNKNK